MKRLIRLLIIRYLSILYKGCIGINLLKEADRIYQWVITGKLSKDKPL